VIEFKIPDLAENVTSGTVSKITVKAGDSVKKDQTLLELETDKAVLEIPSPADGSIKEVLIKEGDEVKVGQVVLKIESGAGAPPPAKEQPKAAPAAVPVAETKTAAPAKPEAPKQQAPAPAPVAEQRKDVPAAPSVRRFAREIGIDVGDVPGTGPRGRISIEDIKAYAKALNTGARPGTATAGTPAFKPLPDFTKWGQIERKPMNNVRKATANHLSYCWSTIPHVTQFDKADITVLEQLRKKHSTKDRKLTITPFLLKVITSALKTFPQFNASVDMSKHEVVYKKYFNIGVAVDTDRGLIVPVLRDVDKKSIFDLAVELNEIAERARNGKTGLDEMQGGSFTITNLGGIGGTGFTPIVNSPEVAILGVSRARLEPVYEGNHSSPRLLLPLSLSYDHRIVDGADGARFLRWVCEAIEQPFLMELTG